MAFCSKQEFHFSSYDVTAQVLEIKHITLKSAKMEWRGLSVAFTTCLGMKFFNHILVPPPQACILGFIAPET